MTVWIVVTMLYAADGSKHYEPGEHPYERSSECIDVATKATEFLMSMRKGYAMCIPRDQLGQLLRK